MSDTPLSPSPSPLVEFLLSRSREVGTTEGERVVFEPGTLAELQKRLLEVEAGDLRQATIRELAHFGAFLSREYQANETARQLIQALEPAATLEYTGVVAREVEKTGERAEAVGKQFTDFQGSKGEQLPDTGERLDPKLIPRPIRG